MKHREKWLPARGRAPTKLARAACRRKGCAVSRLSSSARSLYRATAQLHAIEKPRVFKRSGLGSSRLAHHASQRAGKLRVAAGRNANRTDKKLLCQLVCQRQVPRSRRTGGSPPRFPLCLDCGRPESASRTASACRCAPISLPGRAALHRMPRTPPRVANVEEFANQNSDARSRARAPTAETDAAPARRFRRWAMIRCKRRIDVLRNGRSNFSDLRRERSGTRRRRATRSRPSAPAAAARCRSPGHSRRRGRAAPRRSRHSRPIRRSSSCRSGGRFR